MDTLDAWSKEDKSLIPIIESLDKENQRWDDHCYLCEEGGDLICCETCSNSVHIECVGLEKEPDDDWFCDECKKPT